VDHKANLENTDKTMCRCGCGSKNEIVKQVHRDSWKDPAAKAREIVKDWITPCVSKNCDTSNAVKEIAAVLDAERKTGRKEQEELSNLEMNALVDKVRIRADAIDTEGYRRGLEEAAKVIDAYQVSGKFEVGYGFVNNLKELADRIRQLGGERDEKKDTSKR